MRKSKVRIIVGIIISLVFIYLSIKNISLKRLSESLYEINNIFFYFSFVITCFFSLLAMFFRGIRWKYLITFHKTNSFYLFLIENFGYFVNYILPGKVGELAKSYLVSDDKKLPFLSVFSTVLVERILDLTFILFLGVFIPNYVIESSSLFIKIRFFSFFLLIIIFIFIFVVFLFKNKFENIAKGLNVLKKPINIFICIISTILVWFFTILSIYVLYKGMLIDLPFFNAVITLYLFALGITIPSAPGDIGPFHFFIKISLTMFGINSERALSFAIIYHFSQFISVLPIGLFITLRKGIKWR